MPEPDSIQPTLDTNGAPDLAADRNNSAAQGGGPGSTGPEVRADPTTSPEQPPARLPAEQVGRYPVLGEIGRGGMGVVLHGRDPELGRDLALKVLLSDLAGR